MAEADLFLATASGENVKLWRMPNLDLHNIWPFNDIVNCTCWSSNNSLLATSVGGSQINVSNLKGDSTVDIKTGEEQLCLCFSSNSRYLLSGSIGGVAQIWDLKHRTSRKSFKDQKASILCATFNHNDTTIASGSANGDVFLHNVVSGAYTGPLKLPQTQAIRGIQFSNFIKQMLATASDDSSVNLWDVNTQQIVKEFRNEHKMPANGISFSPANDMLMCSIGIDKKIVFYDVVGKKIVKSINTDVPLTSVDFHHNGSTLAVGSSTGKLYLFDLRAGSTPTKSAVADKSSIKTVSFQKHYAKGSAKGLVRRGSNSSIGSATSNKSREGSSDFKESKTTSVVQQEQKEALSSELNKTSQPVSSLFSPLRVGEPYSAGLAKDDADIVPLQAMRAELLKKSSMYSEIQADRQATIEPMGSSQSEGSVSRLHESSNLRGLVTTEHRSKEDPSNVRPRLSKTSSDSRLSYKSEPQGDYETNDLPNLDANGNAAPRENPSQRVTTKDEDLSNGLHQFQVDFVRSMIEDAIEDTRESMHRSFLHLQTEMLRQFHLQQEEFRLMMERMSPNQQLIEENARLKEEIKRLKTNF